MMAAMRTETLLERLPAVDGSYTPDAPLRDMTWFRVGGPADVLFRPANSDDLASFIQRCPSDIPITVIGAGANMLVRDGGVRGVVVRLGKGFRDVRLGDEGLRVGAGSANVNLALRARDLSLDGFAFLRGIPGSVGGALRMNAGAYGSEIKDIIVAARAIDAEGNLRWFSAEELEYSYRHCGLPDDYIFTEAVFRAEPGDRDQIARQMLDISAERATTQPVKSSTGGSTFANPDGAKAWELVDRVGCRGLVIGDAQVSEQHCNFLINRGNATAQDLETLGDTVRQRVLDQTGIALRWEIRRIGEPVEVTS